VIQAGQMVLFARVVEAGSFAAAAKSLGQTRAAVSKQIAALEERIGAQLLHRTTRRMHLTEIGEAFYTRCARIAAEVEEAEQTVASLQGAPRGSLRIVAPVTLGRRHLAPLLADFLAEHPEIRIDLALSDAPTDAEDAFDVAIRVAPRIETGDVARCLAPSAHVVCASPSYFERRGRPEQPEDLRQHDCLLYSSLPSPSLWRFRDGKTVRVRGRFAVNHGETLRQAAMDGLGIAYMPTFIVGEDLADGTLESVLDAHAHSVQKVWIVHPRSRNLAPKVRVFVDHVTQGFESGPPWEQGGES
jgi:DNA-binding transcriptional LysR family regulator